MMGTKMVKQLRDALSNLNPDEVRREAETPVIVELFASDQDGYRRMGKFFVPPEVTESKRKELRTVLFRAGEATSQPTLRIYEEGMPHGPDDFTFYHDRPNDTVREILDRHPDLALALGRRFPCFRNVVVDRIIREVSKENALFSLATAVPYIMPFVSLPWAIGEFASDTAFLTMNQVRMLFRIAAASDREVGYKEQRTQIASLVAGAFGWRALARELVGKIPLGGGLIPKAAVAYAGTYVVGTSFERFYRLGYGFSRAERKAAYQGASEKGKAVASSLMESYRRHQPASTRG